MERKILEITDMDLSGRGIGRSDGKVVFIPGAVSGDVVTYETEISKKRFDIGRLCEIVSCSAERCEPECGGFGQCGGCVFMNISRNLERDIKRRAVESAFRRAGIKDIRVKQILSGNNRRYRNKAVFHRGNDGTYGYFTAGTHDCYGRKECLLVPEIFNDIVRYAESFFTERTNLRSPESIMLRIGNGDVMIVVQVEGFGEGDKFFDAVVSNFPQIKSAYECVGYPTSYDAKFRLHGGSEYIETEFMGTHLRISPKSFFQVNTEVAKLLCGEIADRLSPSNGDLILDLYCGIGTIGLTVAKRFPKARIMGVEINDSAISDAVINSEISGIKNAEFLCADAGKVSFGDKSPYSVIVDPPRYGLTDSMIKTILKLKPELLVYMSCDPGTLAGDAGKLISGGYSIRECLAADMFPECAHVESLCIFERL